MNEEDNNLVANGEVDINANDASILELLPDKAIFMNVTSVADLCSEWKRRIVELDLTPEKITNNFSYFTSFDILDKYVVYLATAINSLTTSVEQVIESINNTKNDHVNVDSTYSGYSGIQTYNYSSNSGSTSFDNFGTTVDNSNNNTDITYSEVIAKLELEDYLLLSIVLSSIVSSNNTDFSSLIIDDIKMEDIRNEILKSTYIREDLKNLVQTIDIDVLRQILKKSISNGNLGLINDDNIIFFNDYLTKIASINDMKVSDLLNDNNKLYDSISDYSKAIEYVKNISEKGLYFTRTELFNIYDGNLTSEKDSGLILTIRTIIDSLAIKNDSTVEELLSGDFSKSVKNLVSSDFFFDGLCKMDVNVIQNMLGYILS